MKRISHELPSSAGDFTGGLDDGGEATTEMGAVAEMKEFRGLGWVPLPLRVSLVLSLGR